MERLRQDSRLTVFDQPTAIKIEQYAVTWTTGDPPEVTLNFYSPGRSAPVAINFAAEDAEELGKLIGAAVRASQTRSAGR